MHCHAIYTYMDVHLPDVHFCRDTLLLMLLFFSGIIVFVYAFISLLNICVLVSLMYGRFPWYYSNWNCTRRQGNQLLINSGIRALTPDKQLEYMNDKQINDISRYYRQFNILHPLIKAKN